MNHSEILAQLNYAAADRLYKAEEWQDQSRVRSGHAANNLAIVRYIVMNLLRLNASRKASLKSKRMLAATIDQVRAELLGFMP